MASGVVSVLNGSLVNRGSVHVGAGTLAYGQGGAQWDNAGALTVDAGTPGATLTLGTGTTFTDDTGGSVTDTGTITSSGAIVQGNGTETGNAVQVDGGSLAFTGTGTPAAYTVMPGAGATASGAIVAGVHLTVNAADNCSGAQPATLTFTADTTSAGTVELGHTGACPNGPGEVAVAAGKTLTSSGTLLIDGTTGPEVLQGAFVNTGTVSALTGSTQLQGSGSSFVNDGSMTVAASASFGVDAGTSFTNGDANATGPVSLADNGTFADAGTLTEGGGTTSGNQPLATGSLAYTGTGTSSIDVPPAATTALSGNLAAGQTLTVTGADLCGGASPGVANAAGSFTNDGTIQLQYAGTCLAGDPTLNLPAGDTLTNDPGATLVVQGAPNGGVRSSLSGSILNEGTLHVAAGTTDLGSGSTLTNQGAIVVDAGATLSLATGDELADPSGTITDSGAILTAGQVVQGQGVETGNPVTVAAGPLDLVGTGSGAFEVPPSSTVALVGPVRTGQTLVVNGNDSCGGSQPTVVDAAGSFTNTGTIDLLHSGGCGGGAATLSFPAGSTLTNQGTVEFTGTTGAQPSTLAVAVVNQGTVSSQIDAQITGDLADAGVLQVTGGTFSVTGGTTVDADGQVTVGTGATASLLATTIQPGGQVSAQAGATLDTSTLTNDGLLALASTAAVTAGGASPRAPRVSSRSASTTAGRGPTRASSPCRRPPYRGPSTSPPTRAPPRSPATPTRSCPGRTAPRAARSPTSRGSWSVPAWPTRPPTARGAG